MDDGVEDSGQAATKERGPVPILVAAAWGADTKETRSPRVFKKHSIVSEMLPLDEMLQHIFSFLSTRDCVVLGAVCHRFRAMTRRGSVSSLSLGRRVLSSSWYTLLVSAITFSWRSEVKGADGLHRLLRGCPGLRELNINGVVSLRNGRLASLGTLEQLLGFTGFPACKELRRLSLHSCRQQAVRNLCKLQLGKCPSLKELVIAGCPLSKDMGPLLQKLLSPAGGLRLEKLTVNGWIEFYQTGIKDLTIALYEGAGRQLVSLDLCHGHLPITDLACVFYTRSCPRLRTLRLAFASICAADAALLFEALAGRQPAFWPQHHAHDDELDGDELEDEENINGGHDNDRGRRPQGSSALPLLEHLDLSFNHFGSPGVMSLALALKSLTRLRTLCLVGLRIEDESLSALARALGPKGPPLADLDLSLNRFTGLGVSRLAARIDAGYLPQLTALNLSQNAVGACGLKALVEALVGRDCRCRLVALGLCNAELGDGAMPCVVKLLAHEHGQALTHLNLSCNGFHVAAMWTLIQALQRGAGSGLESLNLGLNVLGGWGAAALAGALDSGACPRLVELDVAASHVETWAAKDLMRALAARWEARRKHKWRVAAASQAVVAQVSRAEEKGEGRGEEVTWWTPAQLEASVEEGVEGGRSRGGDQEAWPIRRPQLYLGANPLGWRGVQRIGEEALMRRADILLSLGWRQKFLLRLLRKDRVVAVLDDRLTIGLGVGLGRWFSKWGFV